MMGSLNKTYEIMYLADLWYVLTPVLYKVRTIVIDELTMIDKLENLLDQHGYKQFIVVGDGRVPLSTRDFELFFYPREQIVPYKQYQTNPLDILSSRRISDIKPPSEGGCYLM